MTKAKAKRLCPNIDTPWQKTGIENRGDIPLETLFVTINATLTRSEDS
jgi:hypothetical protein